MQEHVTKKPTKQTKNLRSYERVRNFSQGSSSQQEPCMCEGKSLTDRQGEVHSFLQLDLSCPQLVVGGGPGTAWGRKAGHKPTPPCMNLSQGVHGKISVASRVLEEAYVSLYLLLNSFPSGCTNLYLHQQWMSIHVPINA